LSKNINKEFGLTVKKNEDFSEWYSQVVEKAGLADYISAKGFIIVRPYGYAIWELIKDYLDSKFKETGHVNGFLPCLIPEGLLNKEEKHFKGFNPEVFWVTSSGDSQLSERLALRPTSEALLYSVFPKWISSYRDLPIKINFWNTALRAEIKSTKPFIRNSEFLWQEGHTAHTDNEGAKEQVFSILTIYKNFIEKILSIPTISGFKSNKEKFVGADYTTTLEGLMPDGKALQLGTSHNLGRNFSQPFEIRFLNSNNKEEFVWQTSWGISWRLIGALIMVHGDDKGLILPPIIAPIQIIIIPIYKDQNQELVKKHANSIRDKLNSLGYRALVDDRDEFTAGWKYNEWEMKGVPIRINIGQRDIENNTVEVVRRDNREKRLIPLDAVFDEIRIIFQILQSDLYRNAFESLKNRTFVIKDVDELKSRLDNGQGGFMVSNWCGKEECEEGIKEDTGADIRVLPFDTKDLPIEPENNEPTIKLKQCVYCQQDASRIAVFARAY
jgi:prolyl-tRNA synthetase